MSDSPLFQAPAVDDSDDTVLDGDLDDELDDLIDDSGDADSDDFADGSDQGSDTPAAAADAAPDANAPTALAVLTHITKALVGQPDLVEIASSSERGAVRFDVTVGPDDAGRVIGRRGRIAGSLRQVVRAAGARDGVDVRVEIVDR